MRSVRAINNHERAWLAHQCPFGEKIARVSIFQFTVNKILLQVQMFIGAVEFKWKELFFIN